MRRTVFAVLALLFLLPLTVQAQEIELATYTPEQRWERASSQLVVSFVSAISFAKSVGQTPEGFAQSVINLFAPGWGEPGSGTLGVVGGMNRNYLMFTESEFELVEQSETSVTARSNRPWLRYFGEDEIYYGVTVEEFETVFRMFNEGIAKHLGLGYEGWTEDGWAYMKFSLGG